MSTLGRFRILGRKVNLFIIKEKLEESDVSFEAQRTEQPPAVSVEILADSLFIQVSLIINFITVNEDILYTRDYNFTPKYKISAGRLFSLLVIGSTLICLRLLLFLIKGSYLGKDRIPSPKVAIKCLGR